MKYLINLRKKKTFGPVLLSLFLFVVLLFLPTGYEGALSYQNADRVDALVLSTDESDIVDTGLVRNGEQRCQVRILSGQFKGREVTAVNQLNGSLAEDKLFSVGDKAFVVVSHAAGEITTVYMTDHFRLDKEVILAVLFILLLLLFARDTGLRAILSFIDTILLMWKVLIPSLLNGWNPIWVSIILVLLLTFPVLSLIYGWDRRCLASISGAALGILVTAVLGYLFTDLFQIHGAVMDLSVDICSAVYEVVEKKPDISARDAILSGFAVGRAACGSTTTTLLLAYSGSYIALLMVFMAQGTPIMLTLNYKYVAAEIIHTIVGSFGLVTVAPLTAVTSGILLTKRKNRKNH